MAEDIVPPELLVPPDAGSRIDRYEPALILDGYLRRLAVQDARCRMVLGRLARAFVRRRGQQRLGFSRLGDWTRERLGMSARECQSLATVVARVEKLPAIGAAFERGEVSWAKLRLLVTVARADTEAAWLARARRRTVRALSALAQATCPSVPPEDQDDAEPRTVFRLRCPAAVRRLWHEGVELARRMAGSHVSQGGAAELIAAEGLSAAPDGVAALGPAPPDPSHDDPDETTAAFAEELDWEAVRQALPEDVAPLAVGCERLDAFALDERMRRVVRTQQRAAWQMGRLLRIFLDRRLFLVLGFPSAARYVRERLGCSDRTVRALVALERRSWQAPELGEAYRTGQLSWTRALTILPLARDDTAGAWVARAGEVTVRRLQDEVEWAMAAGTASPPPPDADLRQMCAHEPSDQVDAEVVFSAPVSVVALLRTAILAFRRPAEPAWRGLQRLLEHVAGEWRAQPRHRDPVFERDGWRCAVPCCTARRNLHDHHIAFRSRGGDNALANRTCVCAGHHLHGIHAGYVRAVGTAPGAITWDLGVRAGQPPLLRLRGDRYA